MEKNYNICFKTKPKTLFFNTCTFDLYLYLSGAWSRGLWDRLSAMCCGLCRLHEGTPAKV